MGDSSLASQSGPCMELIVISPEPAMFERTIMVDTNYLMQVNQEDIMEMLFNPCYEDKFTEASKLIKKQMIKLLRDVVNRKLDLCFTNHIAREFVCRQCMKKGLIKIYMKYITVLTPREAFESEFLNVSAAINSQIPDPLGKGEINDTYSYILAALAGSKYFVTEDKHVTSIYKYLAGIREGDSNLKAKEIKNVNETYKILNSQETAFPIDDVLKALFGDLGSLPVPIKIGSLGDSLPNVLDKEDVLVRILRFLQEIGHLRASSAKVPDGWDESLVEKSRLRISAVAKSVGISDFEKVDPSRFGAKLRERIADWTGEPSDQQLAEDLGGKVSDLRAIMYKEEVGYMDWEDQFSAEEPVKEFKVECGNCRSHVELEAYYDGVVEVDDREMGTENLHEWSGEIECPSCGNLLEVVYRVWEYPVMCFNTDETECEGCKLLPEKKSS
ncbi:MAG: hypothetical protein WED05_05635 [Candidatus Atabeyarchaeum deiterrae]